MSLLNLLSPRQHLVAVAIISTVARCYSLKPDELMGKRRQRPVVEARQIAMYALRSQLGLTTVMIGKLFNRDHGTVLHACTQVEAYLKTDKSFTARWPQLVKRVLAARDAAEKGMQLEEVA